MCGGRNTLEVTLLESSAAVRENIIPGSHTAVSALVDFQLDTLRNKCMQRGSLLCGKHRESDKLGDQISNVWVSGFHAARQDQKSYSVTNIIKRTPRDIYVSEI